MSISPIFLLFLLAYITNISSFYLNETQRVIDFYNSGKQWPPNLYKHSKKFDENMRIRQEKINKIPSKYERWTNYIQYTQSLILPRFTKQGFQIYKTPKNVQDFLYKKLHIGLATSNYVKEQGAMVVSSPAPSNLIQLSKEEMTYVLLELLPYHEEWSGLKLEPIIAYGIRSYTDGAVLSMHYDKCMTHVISSIVHIDHEYEDDNNPWPIEIEDHDGELQTKVLERGEMLFYESSTCLHGRRKTFRGKHYSSVFVHYKIKNENIWNCSMDMVYSWIPPGWYTNVIEGAEHLQAGSAITTDDRLTENIQHRVIFGKKYDKIDDFWAEYNKEI